MSGQGSVVGTRASPGSGYPFVGASGTVAHPVTRVYPNRPAWVAPSRKHWLVEMSKAQPVLTWAAILGACLGSATVLAQRGRTEQGRAKSYTKEWENRTKSIKLGTAPAFWETKATVSDDY